MRDDATIDADLDARGRALAARASSRTISRAGVRPPTNGAYDVGSTWISSRPDPSAASSCGRLVDDPAHVRLGAHARPGGVVQALEPEPAALVRRDAQRVVVEQRRGSRMPWRAARSASVDDRIEPVKCRCRWALGSRRRGRGRRSRRRRAAVASTSR